MHAVAAPPPSVNSSSPIADSYRQIIPYSQEGDSWMPGGRWRYENDTDPLKGEGLRGLETCDSHSHVDIHDPRQRFVPSFPPS